MQDWRCSLSGRNLASDDLSNVGGSREDIGRSLHVIGRSMGVSECLSVAVFVALVVASSC